MVKDLRTTALSLKMHRYPRLDTAPWGLLNAQPFFPSLETLFKTERIANRKDYGVKLTEEVEEVLDNEFIRTSKGHVVPVHRKTTMILSHFKWMRGDYGNLGLPQPEETAMDMQTKLQSPHTAGYVGALASLLLSESGCVHFPKVYGVYAGIAKEHTIDISDDYEDLMDRPWFESNLGSTFELRLRTPQHEGPEFHHTRSQRPTVMLGEETGLLDIEDVDADHVSNPSEDGSASESVMTSTTKTTEHDDDEEEEEDAFEIESCECSTEPGSVDEDDEEPFAWATFSNTPVITTVMEKCEGTFYDLVEQHTDPVKHSAWVAQIVFALAYAQRTIGFVHNDLHGNNVMYVPTDKEFLYYRHNGQCYRVPTYGYIIKIIDFDRATLSVRLIGMKEPRVFVSSQFQPDEEACGQYNMDPFMDPSKPHIGPCSSFDLCRFATSMFWDLFPEGPDGDSSHPLFSVLLSWMTQVDGSSVMFRAKRDNHDRYHGFHLYKVIARNCKQAVPRREFSRLSPYSIPSAPLGTTVLTIDS